MSNHREYHICGCGCGIMMETEYREEETLQAVGNYYPVWVHGDR